MMSTPENPSSPTENPSRLRAYKMAAGAAALGTVGLAADADAEIVYSGVQDISIAQYNSLNLNLDGDGYNDVLLKNYIFAGGNYQGLYVNLYPGKAVGFFSGLAYASALSEGDPIDAATTAGGPFQASMAYGGVNPNAEFNNADSAYIGLAFPINAVNHYGWVRVTIDNAAGTFVVNDWAYDDEPGVGIGAGEIPEPTTLGLLACGAAGVGAMRRRRSANAQGN